ncbi:hypothetical protein ANO11243_008990 [Dothideomycetidae sp. 11243]|nr:hypothetical protein ANO11243_008990 [fungal sp. No.11243]
MGSCLEQAPFCSMIAEKLGRIVISVDYRMGPLSKFPAAVHDAEDVVRAVLEPASAANDIGTDMLDPSRLSLSGFSSGGNLALNLATSIDTDDVDWPSPLSQHHGHPIPTLLFFPSFDQSILPHERTPLETLTPKQQAKIMKPSKLGLSRYLTETYLSAEHRLHPRASPGKASLSAILPGTQIFLVLCEIDTLAKQSEEWVNRVQSEGKANLVQIESCTGMKHGWTQIPDIALSEREKQEKVKVFGKAVTFLSKF